jgi:O-methyltransferase
MYPHYTLKGRILRGLLGRRGIAVVHMTGPRERRDMALIRETRALAPMLVQDASALQILACARAARRLGGSMAEAGVFGGATARLICEVKGDAPLHLFDVFETLQPADDSPTPRAAELRRHFKQTHVPRSEVERLLAPYPAVHLHPGVFPDSTKGFGDERFSFVHIDLDLEPSTRDALEFFHPRLLPGGIIGGDDYNDAGVGGAFDAYFAGRADTLIPLPWGPVIVVKPAVAEDHTPDPRP